MVALECLPQLALQIGFRLPGSVDNISGNQWAKRESSSLAPTIFQEQAPGLLPRLQSECDCINVWI